MLQYKFVKEIVYLMKTIYENLLIKLYEIEKRKQIMPQELLGRTLAYNNFLPRLSDTHYLYTNFRYNPQDSIMPHKGLFISLENLKIMLQDSIIQDNSELESQILCIFIDDTKNTSSDDFIDYISCIRRLMPVFVGYSGIIVDTYQILELAIAGADMCIIDCFTLQCYANILTYMQSTQTHIEPNNIDLFLAFLQHNKKPKKTYLSILYSLFNTLVTFSVNLGITPIIHVHTTQDLRMLVKLKTQVDCLLIEPELIALLPHSYLLFGFNNSLINTTQTLQDSYHFDVVLENIEKNSNID